MKRKRNRTPRRKSSPRHPLCKSRSPRLCWEDPSLISRGEGVSGGGLCSWWTQQNTDSQVKPYTSCFKFLQPPHPVIFRCLLEPTGLQPTHTCSNSFFLLFLLLIQKSSLQSPDVISATVLILNGSSDHPPQKEV